jgi:fatty acid-binding protein DegV
MATLEDLDRLAKSGRVPEAAASAGKWLHLNPLFEFRSGHARPMRPARSRAAALDRIAASCLRPQDHAPGAALHVAALHALAAEPALELLDKVCAEVTPASSFVAPFSPVMLVHTGPGLAGLAWRWVPG